MARREAGIRERVSRALMISAAIYAVAIGVWAIQTRQLSEASPTTTGTKTTITFEEHQAPRLLGTQGTYEYASQGVLFTDDTGNSNATSALSKEGALCNGGVVYTGEQIATSGSNRLHPYPSVSSPLVITFTDNRVSNDVSFQLLGVGDAKNTVEFFDHTDKIIKTQDFVNTGSGVGCDKKQLVSLSATNIAKIRITQPQNANGDDGLAIDDLSFAALTTPVDQSFTIAVAPTTGKVPLEVTLTYTGTTPIDQAVSDGGVSVNWGDGSGGIAVGKTATHTYTKAGTYLVTYSAGDKQTTATVTVTEEPAEEAVAATFTTSKPNYDRGEKVEFTLRNTGTAALQLKNGAPFKVSQGATVKFAPVATQALETIAAGQSKTWSWDQKGDDGQQVADGTYVVTVDFTANAKAYSRSASFTIAATKINQTGTFTVTPTSGVIPLTVSLTCTGDTIRDIVADWGDGSVTSGVTCPTTLSHTYTQVGTYTITLRQGTTVLGTQQVIALASTTDGKGAPTRLASSGANLIVLLLIATVLAGLFSYLIIRRPFHGGTTPTA